MKDGKRPEWFISTNCCRNLNYTHFLFPRPFACRCSTCRCPGRRLDCGTLVCWTSAGRTNWLRRWNGSAPSAEPSTRGCKPTPNTSPSSIPSNTISSICFFFPFFIPCWWFLSIPQVSRFFCPFFLWNGLLRIGNWNIVFVNSSLHAIFQNREMLKKIKRPTLFIFSGQYITLQ